MADSASLVTILESWLTTAAQSAESGKIATVDVQIVFNDGSLSGGKVQHGPIVGTYLLTQKAVVAGSDGRPHQIDGKAIEVFFVGGDIKRLARVVDLEKSSIMVPGSRQQGLVIP